MFDENKPRNHFFKVRSYLNVIHVNRLLFGVTNKEVGVYFLPNGLEQVLSNNMKNSKCKRRLGERGRTLHTKQVRFIGL